MEQQRSARSQLFIPQAETLDVTEVSESSRTFQAQQRPQGMQMGEQSPSAPGRAEKLLRQTTEP